MNDICLVLFIGNHSDYYGIRLAYCVDSVPGFGYDNIVLMFGFHLIGYGSIQVIGHFDMSCHMRDYCVGNYF